jgi:choline dehydrogenase-like flavoprotein
MSQPFRAMAGESRLEWDYVIVGSGVRGGSLAARLAEACMRVADASVFPRMPGFFIVSAIYMIGEKAADVILRDAAQAQ